MSKVYFACSIAGGRDHAHVYQDVVKFVRDAGGTLLSELFADPNLVSEIGTDKKITPRFVWQRDIDWVAEADVVVAEVTQPSLGVGYEIALAEKLNKPVLALFWEDSGKRLSPMIDGNPHITVCTYININETQNVIKEFLKKI